MKSSKLLNGDQNGFFLYTEPNIPNGKNTVLVMFYSALKQQR
jgi:hypothetical protein